MSDDRGASITRTPTATRTATERQSPEQRGPGDGGESIGGEDGDRGRVNDNDGDSKKYWAVPRLQNFGNNYFLNVILYRRRFADLLNIFAAKVFNLLYFYFKNEEI
ncbi:Uncharacterized protein Fot_11785 [Forsythia ovata]|uniref:Uncharacterized protein n=1 Tax=Forsythia ovata TaxID=205694 RepID=A0ABD1WLB5_9LAMI